MQPHRACKKAMKDFGVRRPEWDTWAQETDELEEGELKDAEPIAEPLMGNALVRAWTPPALPSWETLEGEKRIANAIRVEWKARYGTPEVEERLVKPKIGITSTYPHYEIEAFQLSRELREQWWDHLDEEPPLEGW